MQEPISFNNLNETDIREEIIAPLIRRLGYRSGTNNNVVREQSLRYPRLFIGRKNSKKDPILRGSADYILEAGLTVRWVIEAKAPDVDIDIDVIEQAYTYANHPEIRAVYFVLCNGKRFVVFQTNQAPQTKPLLDITYNDFEESYHLIAGLLSPESILRDHPKLELDVGQPIGNGLRSVVRITNGIIGYHGCSLNMAVLREMQTGISGGAVERDENNQLVAYLTTIAPTRSMQNFNQRLGLTSFEMYSKDAYVSSDPSKPTTFRSDLRVSIPAGERILDISSWREISLPCNVTCQVITEASGCLNGNRFHGKFLTSMNFTNFGQVIRLDGEFEIFVA